MSNYNSAYANYKQYNNSDISKPWNYDMQPIRAPIISTIKTNVFGNGPNIGDKHPTLKNAYRFYPNAANNTTADAVLRSTCGGARVLDSKRENYQVYKEPALCYNVPPSAYKNN